jgi:hypothetical protein
MGIFNRPPKLKMSEYRDWKNLSASKKFTLKVYAMYAVGANPLGPDNQYLPESEINERLRKREIDPNDFARILDLLVDRRLITVFS